MAEQAVNPFFQVITHWGGRGEPHYMNACWPGQVDRVAPMQISVCKEENLCLGSGSRGMKSHVCVDRLPGVHPDVVADFDPANGGGIPFPDNTFYHVFSAMTLEHVQDLLGLGEEIWRVCRPGALVDLILPWWSSHRSWGDPTHVRTFADQSITFWQGGAYEQAKEERNAMGQYRPKMDFRVMHHFLVLNPRLQEYPESKLLTAPATELNAVEAYYVRLQAQKEEGGA